MRIDIEARALAVLTGALGAVAALTLAAPTALADPGIPTPVPPLPQDTTVQAAGDPALPAEGVQAAGDPALPAEVVPPAETQHLSSPENLPPGTSITPVDPNQGRGMSYLRDLWHAVQTQEVSGSDALLLLTQRPLNPNATPPAGLPAGPTPPIPAGAPAPLPEALPAPLPEAAPAPLPELAPAPLPEAAPAPLPELAPAPLPPAPAALLPPPPPAL